MWGRGRGSGGGGWSKGEGGCEASRRQVRGFTVLAIGIDIPTAARPARGGGRGSAGLGKGRGGGQGLQHEGAKSKTWLCYSPQQCLLLQDLQMEGDKESK